jgi:poly(3-hydroxybutyrate) depolymerase
LRFEIEEVILAAAFAWAKTGKRIAARIAMIAMTTSSSMSVNARRRSFVMVTPPYLRQDDDDPMLMHGLVDTGSARRARSPVSMTHCCENSELVADLSAP